MERASRQRDARYDGIFFVAVRTTGIFCRPSCPARKPLPRNVEYFDSARAAAYAGYRPCKRCRPLEIDGRAPAWVERLLAELEREPERRRSDAELAASGCDPVAARRYFLKHYGMTFQAYARRRRMSKALDALRHGARLDEAAADHGFSSLSGFRDAFSRAFGAPPGQNREAAAVRAGWIATPLGPMIAGATDDGVCLLEFSDRQRIATQLEALRRRWDCAIVPGDSPHLARLAEELAQYFARERREFSVPIVLEGSPFQLRVWRGLQRIPYGETRSYEELACSLGAPAAQRAVGRANGLNRIAIVVPCHRVVNKSGKLGGYGGGLWRKQFLLDLERASGVSGGLQLNEA